MAFTKEIEIIDWQENILAGARIVWEGGGSTVADAYGIATITVPKNDVNVSIMFDGKNTYIREPMKTQVWKFKNLPDRIQMFPQDAGSPAQQEFLKEMEAEYNRINGKSGNMKTVLWGLGLLSVAAVIYHHSTKKDKK